MAAYIFIIFKGCVLLSRSTSHCNGFFLGPFPILPPSFLKIESFVFFRTQTNQQTEVKTLVEVATGKKSKLVHIYGISAELVILKDVIHTKRQREAQLTSTRLSVSTKAAELSHMDF